MEMSGTATFGAAAGAAASEAGQLVIVDTEGKQWFSGGASAGLSSNHNSLGGGQRSASAPANATAAANANFEQAVPPSVMSALKANARVARKPAKVRAAARQDAPPVHQIFALAADETEDPFWKEILKRMSRGIYRKGFRYFPAISGSSGLSDAAPLPDATSQATLGRLTYRSKTREFECLIRNCPTAAIESTKQFMRANAGIMSDMDQAALSTQISELSKASVQCATPKVWSDIKTAGSRSSLITHYAHRLREELGLTKAATRDLIHTVNLSVASGHFTDEYIQLRHGAIDSIRGLKRDEHTGEFYVEIEVSPSPCVASRRTTSKVKVTVDQPAADPDGDDDTVPSSASGAAASTVTTQPQTAPRRRPARPVDELIAAFASVRNLRDSLNGGDGEPGAVAVPPPALVGAGAESGAKPRAPQAPLAVFSGTVEAVESLFSRCDAHERVILPLTQGRAPISTSFPTKAEIDAFASSYTERYSDIVLAPISAAAYGFATARGTDAKAQALKYAHTAHEGTLKGLVGIPDALRALLEVAIFEGDLNEVKELIQGLSEKLDAEHFDESVFTVRRAESLASAAIQRAQRARLTALSNAVKPGQRTGAPLRQFETPSAIAGGASCRPRATLRRWLKYVDDINSARGAGPA